MGVRKDLQSTREIAGIAPLLGNLVSGPIGAILPLILLSQDVSAEPPGGGKDFIFRTAKLSPMRCSWGLANRG